MGHLAQLGHRAHQGLQGFQGLKDQLGLLDLQGLRGSLVPQASPDKVELSGNPVRRDPRVSRDPRGQRATLAPTVNRDHWVLKDRLGRPVEQAALAGPDSRDLRALSAQLAPQDNPASLAIKVSPVWLVPVVRRAQRGRKDPRGHLASRGP